MGSPGLFARGPWLVVAVVVRPSEGLLLPCLVKMVVVVVTALILMMKWVTMVGESAMVKKKAVMTLGVVKMVEVVGS